MGAHFDCVAATRAILKNTLAIGTNALQYPPKFAPIARRPISGLQCFIPVAEMPSMKLFCVKKKSTSTGSRTSVEAAMS